MKRIFFHHACRCAAFISSAAVLVVATTAPASAEATPKQLFDTLYGSRYAAATASSDRADDRALARELLDAAANASDPDTVALLADKAFLLTESDAATADLAIEAAQLLATTSDANAARARQRLLDLLPRQFAAADGEDKQRLGNLLADLLAERIDQAVEAGDFAEALRTSRRLTAVAAALSADQRERAAALQDKVVRRRLVHARIDNLKRRIERSPNNAALVDELIELYLVELNDRAKALQLREIASPALRNRLDLLAADPETQDPSDLLITGDWLAGLGREAPPANRAALLNAAAERYAAAAARDGVPELVRLRAEAALEQVNQQLASTTVAAEGWVDATALIDLSEHGVAGEWKKVDGHFHGKGEPAVLALPVEVSRNYAVKARIANQSKGYVGIILTIGDHQVHAHLSTRATGEAGLSNIDGKRWFENEALAKIGEIPVKRPFVLGTTVETSEQTASISVSIDGKVVTRWRGPIKALSISPHIKRAAPASGVAIVAVDAVVLDAKVKPR